MRISAPPLLEMDKDDDFLIFAVADTDADIYFQYLWMRMQMLKIMRISADAGRGYPVRIILNCVRIQHRQS